MHWTSPGITSSRFRAEICWGGLSFPSCFTASQYGSGPAEATLPPSHVILDTQKGREQILRTVTFAACLGGNTFFFFFNQVLCASSLSPRDPFREEVWPLPQFPQQGSYWGPANLAELQSCLDKAARDAHHGITTCPKGKCSQAFCLCQEKNICRRRLQPIHAPRGLGFPSLPPHRLSEAVPTPQTQKSHSETCPRLRSVLTRPKGHYHRHVRGGTYQR